MIKKTALWPVRKLVEKHASINFPEYQRESTVWNRPAKQRLVDSMLRQFDIASLYFYRDVDDSIDCIDGRQRIAAIMSFLGQNETDPDDNGFRFRISNEIYEDEDFLYSPLEGKTYGELEDLSTGGDALAKKFLDAFDKYEITVVLLSKSNDPAEFNLQFTRLNLGIILNSGEKLNAMTGEVREECFRKNGLGAHAFLSGISIPTRRFSKEQVAAQILAQAFSWLDEGEFTRTRHFDLQKLFKRHRTLGPDEIGWIDKVRATLDTLGEAFTAPEILRNRAVTVSVVLLAIELHLTAGPEAAGFAQFIEEFLCRLRWQVGKGLDVDDAYRYLIDFQKNVTQASVEKPAVGARAELLRAEFAHWQDNESLLGDAKYREDNDDSDPATDCRE